MRRTGWLLLAACLALAGAVGWVIQKQKALQALNAPKKPNALPAGIQAQAGAGWVWTKKDGERDVAEVRAMEFTQLNDPPRVQLRQVQVKIFHKDGGGYDLVKSPAAELKAEEGALYADGEVEMTMGVKLDPEARNRLVQIKTSGVTYNTQTGQVTTDRHATFEFENSRGSATGASYDPAVRDLLMKADVKLDWHKGPRTMHVESGQLKYREDEEKIYLSPWSKLIRETLTLNARSSIVTLRKGELELVEADNARGEDKQPKRNLDYAADKLFLRFAEGNTINRIEGEGNARLVTRADAGVTTVTSRRVDMDFDVRDNDSLLRKALAQGDTVVRSEPVRAPERVMKSNVVAMAMRNGGEEIESVETHSPGEIEFLPRGPADRYRKLNGEKFWIRYASKNQIETFRAVKAVTFTKGKPKLPDARTTSEELLATFDPVSGDMIRLEQWDNFQYEEGERKARATKAVMEQAVEMITLTGGARIWDLTGSTDAARIELDQKSGNMTATGKVASTRLPEKKTKAKSSLVDSSETVQARAGKMTTRDGNTWIRYEGGATMWQGADRVEAGIITIDRKAQTFRAQDNVFTQTREKPKPGAQGQTFTLVRAPELFFHDLEKTAHYVGGVTMDRGGLNVKSQELRAWFSKDDRNALERALAERSVTILQNTVGRVRNGSSERAEYDVADGRVVLSGGAPEFHDSVKGSTRGQKITWFADNDRLLVDGETASPTESRIKRKKTGK
jgi:lipopolysaccharide export system protein LptA